MSCWTAVTGRAAFPSIFTFVLPSTTTPPPMTLAKSLRTLRARWRLHRMEWNAMQRPLQPPKGYEHFHTSGAVFPGLEPDLIKVQSFHDFRIILYRAWRLYRHNFIPDPEITKQEQEMERRDREQLEKKLDNMWKRGERFAEEGRQMAEEIVDDVKDKKPDLERVVRNRVGVLRGAIQQFSDGYHETISGAKDVWGNEPYNMVLVKEDNPPLIYESLSNPPPP